MHSFALCPDSAAPTVKFDMPAMIRPPGIIKAQRARIGERPYGDFRTCFGRHRLNHTCNGYRRRSNNIRSDHTTAAWSSARYEEQSRTANQGSKDLQVSHSVSSSCNLALKTEPIVDCSAHALP